MTGLAGRITVNSALLSDPSKLTVYSTSPLTAAGDTTRSDFLYSQLTSGDIQPIRRKPDLARPRRRSPARSPASAAVPQPAGQCRHLGDAVAAGPGRRRQHIAAEVQLHRRRQHRHRNVEPDRAAEFLCRQCSRDVGRSEHDDELAAGSNVRRSQMAISSINYGASVLGQSVQNLKNQLTSLQAQLTTGAEVDDLCRDGRQRRFRGRGARATGEHFRVHRYHDQRHHHHQCGQYRAAVAVVDRRPGAERCVRRRRRI